jgi:hypothetical protein
VSLAIDVEQVTAVLLSDGEWIYIQPGTFQIGSYEFVTTGGTAHSAGNGGVCATGFQLVDTQDGERISGPLTAIQAVSHSPEAPAD